MQYSKELRDAVLRRLLPPKNESISTVASQAGLSEQTLRNWLNEAREDGVTSADALSTPEDKWSSEAKFLVVHETFDMSESELSEYARQKGLYVDQIKDWRNLFVHAGDSVSREVVRLNGEFKASEKARRELEKQVDRLQKALAETAALLVLRKKADAIWGDRKEE